MAMTSYPRVGATTTDAQYQELFDEIVGSGVRDPGDVRVFADSTGLNVKVDPGFAVVAGNAFKSDAVETLAIAANSGSNSRIDTIVLRRDPALSGAIVRLAVVQGTASATPARPSLTQVRTARWDEPIADVLVAGNAATISAANVTDRRRLLSSRVGVWTTATRPAARQGRIGLNTTTGRWEGHNGTAWADVTPATFPASVISDPQNLTAGNATKIDGRRIYVQATAPSSPSVNDLWFW